MPLSAWKIRLLIGYTGVVTGAAFLLAAMSVAASEVRFLARSETTQGIVIANLPSKMEQAPEQIGKPLQSALCPQFRYETKDKNPQTLTSSACASPPSFSVGEKVRVHYLKSHSATGQIDSFGAEWGLVLGFGIGGGVLLLIGLPLLRGLQSRGFSLDPITFWD